MIAGSGVSIQTLLLTLDGIVEHPRCTGRTVERLIAARSLPVVKISEQRRAAQPVISSRPTRGAR